MDIQSNSVHLNTVVRNVARSTTPSYILTENPCPPPSNSPSPNLPHFISQSTTQPATQHASSSSSPFPNPTTWLSQNQVNLSTQSSSASNANLMMTAEVVACGPRGHQAVARALLDPASTASFITERLANQLQLPKQKQSICINGIGDTQYVNRHNKVVEVKVKSARDSASLEKLNVTVLPPISKVSSSAVHTKRKLATSTITSTCRSIL